MNRLTRARWMVAAIAEPSSHWTLLVVRICALVGARIAEACAAVEAAARRPCASLERHQHGVGMSPREIITKPALTASTVDLVEEGSTKSRVWDNAGGLISGAPQNERGGKRLSGTTVAGRWYLLGLWPFNRWSRMRTTLHASSKWLRPFAPRPLFAS